MTAIKRIVILSAMSMLCFYALYAYAVKGADLTTGSGVPFRAVGFDMPFLLLLDDAQSEAAFAKMKTLGIRAVRINASMHGNSPGSFQTAPGEFREDSFKKLDRVLALADNHGIGVVLVISDIASAGIYSAWAGGSNNYVFFRDKISRERFKKFINKLVTRVNTVNAKPYSSDLAVLGWEICGRAYYPGNKNYKVIYGWAGEIAGHIKTLGAKQPVSLSLNENETTAQGFNAADIFMTTTVDYVTYMASTPAEAGLICRTYYEAVNKPSVCVVSGTMAGEAAAEFFKAGGSVIFFAIPGFGPYASAPNAFSLSDEKSISSLKSAVKSAAAHSEPVRLAGLSNVSVKPSSQSAEISFAAASGAKIEILAGRRLPLKEVSAEAVASKGLSKTVIQGLVPGEKYMLKIRVKDGDKAIVSGIFPFETSKLQRLKVKPFKRSNNFITVKGTQFYDGNRVYKYLGTGNYYIRHTDRETADYILREAAAVGFKVIRIGSNAEAESFDSIDANSRDRFLRIGPDYFNEEAYKNIDWVLDRAAKYGLRVILHFTDNWEYYGGIPVYTKWAGVSKNQFYTDEKAKAYYRQTIDAFVNRRNTVNGKLYRDDPTIFAYNLCNEPRNEDDPTGKTIGLWADEMAGYVKSLAPNHLVTTGADSFFNKEDGTHYSGADYVTIHSSKHIDYCNFHIYPTYTHNNFALSTTEWMLKKFIKEAHETLGKPVVMEEYGIGSNLPDYPKAKWIYEMTRIFFENGGNGANYWFFIEPGYAYGDGFEVRPTETEYMNAFIPWTNKNNAGGY